jgi:hypothetical protein
VQAVAPREGAHGAAGELEASEAAAGGADPDGAAAWVEGEAEDAVALQAGGEPPDLSLADRNHDGRVDFREFAALHAPREQAPATTPAPGPTATR